MNSPGKCPTDYKLYILGLILAVPAAILLFLQNSGAADFDVADWIPPCLFHRVSGLYCPGCGGTRAVKSLLEGRLTACFFYHPFVLYCAAIYILFMVSHTIEFILRKKSPHKKPFVRGLQARLTYLYVGVILILSQWLVKNLLVILRY